MSSITSKKINVIKTCDNTDSNKNMIRFPAGIIGRLFQITSINNRDFQLNFHYFLANISHRFVIKFFLFIFLIAFYPISIFSQDIAEENGIFISFAKKSIILPQATSFFNVVIIENRGSEALSGTLLLKQPETWTLIGQPTFDVSVEAGKKAYYPVRVGVPKKTVGGISYIVQAKLMTNFALYSASSYISVEKKSRWDMKLLNTNVYLSDFRPVGNFDLKLENKGNSNELIKLNFDVGELLKLRTFIEADSILFVELPAYVDTILKFEVFRRKDLSYAETRALIRNWKSTSIYISANTSDYQTYTGLRVSPLESKVINDMPLRNSPLNVDMTLYNLLSFQRPKTSIKIHGKVLFPENQQVQYSFGMYNLYFDPELYQNFDLYQQLRYSVRYNDPKSEILIGDRIGTGILHTMTGNGIKAQHSFNDSQSLSLNLIQNPYGRNIGSFVGYNTMIGRIQANTGVTLESSGQANSKYYSFHLGGSYRFLSHHTIRLQTATTLHSFSKGAYLQNDTTVIGLAYRASYHYNNKKLKFRIDNTNTLFTYLKNAGINRIKSDISYQFNPSSRLVGMYYRNSYASSRYPYNFYFPGNNNRNENARLMYSYSDGKVVYQIGPQFFSTIRNLYNHSNSLSTTYENYQPGMIASVTFLMGHLRSITPNVSINTMYFNYYTNLTDDEPYSISGRWQYTTGLSYNDHSFRLSAYYSSGDASEIYRSVVVDDDPVIGQALHLRPSYERYFNNEKIRLNAYYNFSYFMPSQRENTIFSVSTNFFLDKGWLVYGNLNIFKNSRSDSDIGRITTRDLSLMLGFRKSFDVQQPRMKYYDVAVVGFNDQDGDGVKDENEKPVSNVLINFKRDPKKNKQDKAIFAETKLITDPNGEIYYGKLPEGNYDLEITPLSNLEDLYFLEGRNQQMISDEDKIHYLPLVESYKVKGNVIVDRDPNSSQGRINLEGIRVTGTSENGSSYSVLTTSSGAYVLNLPKANLYTINIYNVFGETFMLEQGTFEVQFMENKTINIDFRFSEQRREIKFNGDKPLFDFQIDRK